MTRSSALGATIAICLVADGMLFAIAAYWTNDLVQALEVFLFAGGPFALVVGWPTYVMLK